MKSRIILIIQFWKQQVNNVYSPTNFPIFLHSTFSSQTYILLICLSLLKCKLYKDRNFVCQSLLPSPTPQRSLAHSKCSINICEVNESLASSRHLVNIRVFFFFLYYERNTKKILLLKVKKNFFVPLIIKFWIGTDDKKCNKFIKVLPKNVKQIKKTFSNLSNIKR